MGEPLHRMAADGAIALFDVRPFGVRIKVQKHAVASLVCALGQHNLVALAEHRTNDRIARHVRNLRFFLNPSPLRSGSRDLWLPGCVYSDLHGPRRPHDSLGPLHFVCRAMSQEEKLVGLERRLVLDDAVLRDSDAVQPRADRAQSTRHNGAFQRGDDPGDQGPGYQHRPDAWDGEESRSEQEPPETAPEGAGLAPALHAVAGIVIPHDVLLRVVILADDGQLLHVEPRPLKFLQCFLGLGMTLINGDNCVLFIHAISLSKVAAIRGAPASAPAPAIRPSHGYLAAAIFPISVPITSPEITSSTRRLSCRPSAVSLDATGWVFPKPFVVTDVPGIPCSI